MFGLLVKFLANINLLRFLSISVTGQENFVNRIELILLKKTKLVYFQNSRLKAIVRLLLLIFPKWFTGKSD